MLVDGDVRIGVFPEGEELFVDSASRLSITLECVGATETEASQRSKRVILNDGAVIENLLKFRTSFIATAQQAYWLPTLTAAIEINRRNPAKAVETLQLTVPYELGEPYPSFQGGGSMECAPISSNPMSDA